jgi:hypothetical protein
MTTSVPVHWSGGIRLDEVGRYGDREKCIRVTIIISSIVL